MALSGFLYYLSSFFSGSFQTFSSLDGYSHVPSPVFFNPPPFRSHSRPYPLLLGLTRRNPSPSLSKEALLSNIGSSTWSLPRLTLLFSPLFATPFLSLLFEALHFSAFFGPQERRYRLPSSLSSQVPDFTWLSFSFHTHQTSGRGHEAFLFERTSLRRNHTTLRRSARLSPAFSFFFFFPLVFFHLRMVLFLPFLCLRLCRFCPVPLNGP